MSVKVTINFNIVSMLRDTFIGNMGVKPYSPSKCPSKKSNVLLTKMVILRVSVNEASTVTEIQNAI